jgi:ABC-type multidrug transport system ATPase subunit/pSer/pThr/pTyr-binding forkhead associated (FHA) protein
VTCVFGSFTIHSRDGDQEFSVAQSVVNVGRAADNDLTLPFATVSQHHARVLADSAGCGVMDLGSCNGTNLNGVEIPVKVVQPLHEGDVVDIGPFQLFFHEARARAGAPTPAAPPTPAGPTVVLPPSGPAQLIVRTPEWTREFPLKKDSVTLGREADNDIVVDVEAVSRHHAVLQRRGTSYVITDLGSTNGLSVGGQLVKEKQLAQGVAVSIGRTVTMDYRPAQELAADVDVDALRAAVGAPAPAVYDIRDGHSLVLGRGADTGVQMSHPLVSAQHAEVERRADQVIIRDMGSSAGTYVNGQLVSQQSLREGDVIRIGPNQLIFQAGQLCVVEQEGTLRLDAFHLVRTVGKGKKILNDVSLSIKPREFVAVVGGSGAGKSTLVTALCGFKPANEGAVLLNGVDLYHNFAAYRNEMGYVPQDDIIHADLSIHKALDYAAQLRMPSDTTRAEREQRVRDVIAELDLAPHADKAIRQLSGGQRKRASIGVELLTRPSLFFLDEATSGLDPNTETQLMKLLRKLADQGRTVILITHATKNVMMCDKVCFMARGGYLGFYGPPEEALAYFGVQDFDEIYDKLDNVDTPEQWAQRFLASAQLQQYVVKPLSEVVQGGPAAAAAAPPSEAVRAAARRTSTWRQFGILCRRYLAIIAADRKTLALLLALAPLLGLLDLVVWKKTMLDPVLGDVGAAMSMILMACIIGMLVGTLSSVREIVKEREIYKRERMVSLKLVPYIGSKVLVGTIFAIYSGTVLFLFKIFAIDYGFLGAQGYFQLLVTMIFIVWGGMMWGLLVSAVAPTEDRAMLLAVLVIIPQLIFAGALMPLSDLGAVGAVFGAVASTRWALESMTTISHIMTGTGSAADPTHLIVPGIKGMKTMAEKVAAVKSLDKAYGAIFDVNVYRDWLWMVLIGVGLFFIILYLQKRRDIL